MSTTMVSSAETVFAGPQPSPVKRWLRQPLLHFLLVGRALFAVYRALNPEPDTRGSPEQT
jgi:hypothetical protein